MSQSVGSVAGADGTRFQALRDALVSLRGQQWATQATGYQQEAGTRVNVFAYAFGLQQSKGGGEFSSAVHGVIDVWQAERPVKRFAHGLVDQFGASWREARGKNDYAPVACDLLSLLTAVRRLSRPIDADAEDLVPRALVPAVSDVPSDRHVAELGQLAREYGRDGWERIAAEYLTEPGQVDNVVTRLRREPELAAALARLTPVLSPEQLALVLDQVRTQSRLGRAAALTQQVGVARRAALDHLGNLGTIRQHLRLVRGALLELAVPLDVPVSATNILARLRLNAASLLFEAADAIGDTTLPLDEALHMIEVSTAGRASLVEELIYGRTPMRQALRTTGDRFERELSGAAAGTRAVLLLFTDGAATDGDPGFEFERIAQLGVTIVVCYLTDRDLDEPRVLHGAPRDTWQPPARMLFDNASPLRPGHPLAVALEAGGWQIEPGARYFFQGNHPALIAGLVEATAQ